MGQLFGRIGGVIKESIDSCGFSPQTIAQLKKEKITAKDKTLLKKLNQEILDIKQNADETKKKLKRLNNAKKTATR